MKKNKRSKLLITQIAIFSMFAFFNTIALIGALVSPLIVYGRFIFLGSKMLILAIPLALYSISVYGLVKRKSWSYGYGFALIVLNMAFMLLQLYLDVKVLLLGTFSEYALFNNLLILNLVLVIITLMILSFSLYVQIKIKDELRGAG